MHPRRAFETTDYMNYYQHTSYESFQLHVKLAMAGPALGLCHEGSYFSTTVFGLCRRLIGWFGLHSHADGIRFCNIIRTLAPTLNQMTFFFAHVQIWATCTGWSRRSFNTHDYLKLRKRWNSNVHCKLRWWWNLPVCHGCHRDVVDAATSEMKMWKGWSVENWIYATSFIMDQDAAAVDLCRRQHFCHALLVNIVST